MGDPLSSPLSLIYVAYDEHAFMINTSLTDKYTRALLLIVRFADDLLRLIAIPTGHDHLIQYITYDLVNNIYEHDLNYKALEVIPDNNVTNKFLDADVIIYDNGTRIKLIYHNKNASILHTHNQTVKRLHHAHAYLPTRIKINACTTIMTRIYDYCTQHMNAI